MKNAPFSYTVSLEADCEVFLETCRRIEAHFPDIVKEKLLIDVDGSCYQIYHTEHGRIDVDSDCFIDAVYVDSEVCLDDFITSLV